MQTKIFEASAELVAQVKAGISASTARTIVSEEEKVTYLRKNITFMVSETEGGLALESSAAGAGDFLFEAGWVQGLLEGKDPNEQPVAAPKEPPVPVPATVIAAPAGPSCPKPNPTTFGVSAAPVLAAIEACDVRSLGATEEGVTTYVSKAQFTITETAEGFVLASSAAGPGDFYAELNWINSVLPAEEAPAEEAKPAEEKPAPAPAEKPAPTPATPAPAAPSLNDVVAVAPKSVKETAVTAILAVAGAALISAALIKKIFKK